MTKTEWAKLIAKSTVIVSTIDSAAFALQKLGEYYCNCSNQPINLIDIAEAAGKGAVAGVATILLGLPLCYGVGYGICRLLNYREGRKQKRVTPVSIKYGY